MRSIVILTWLIFLLISCAKTSPVTISPGSYRGTFKRTSINKVSDVTLTILANGFQGQSQYFHYPDICSGNFTIQQDSIMFENACVYTAEFDWTYILGGKFKFRVYGDSLTITRSYVTGSTDVYSLKKQ